MTSARKKEYDEMFARRKYARTHTPLITEDRYGHYIMKQRINETFIQVSIHDTYSGLIWSTDMNQDEAAGALQLFRMIGYYEMPMK